MRKRTYNIFRFGIWDSVEGSGPINWLFFNILEVQLESQTIIKYTRVLLSIKLSIFQKNLHAFQLLQLGYWKWDVSIYLIEGQVPNHAVIDYLHFCIYKSL